MKLKKLALLYGSFVGLGAYRGYQEFKQYGIDNYLRNSKGYKKQQFYYTDWCTCIITYMILYLCPITIPYCIVQEWNYLEQKIRNIKD